MISRGPCRGRPPRLFDEQMQEPAGIIEGGAAASGLDTGVWTSPIIADMVRRRLGIRYHPSQMRRILHKLGVLIQYPKRRSPKFHFRCVGNFNSVTYPAFFKELVRRYRGRHVHLIAANAKRHKATTVLQWVQADEENIEGHILPKYSPDLNAANGCGRKRVGGLLTTGFSRKKSCTNRDSSDNSIDTRAIRRLSYP